MIENNKLYQDLTKTYTRPVEKIVKFFITSAAFAAILISISIVFTLLTEAINFFQDPAVTFKSISQQQGGPQLLKILNMV